MVFNASENKRKQQRRAIIEKNCTSCGEYIPKDTEVYDDNGFTYCRHCMEQDESETEVDENEIDEDMFF